MAQVTIKKVVEGPSHLVVILNFDGDGTGDLENYSVLSPLELIPARPDDRPAFYIIQIWHSLIWFDLTLGFGGLTPRMVWPLARDTGPHVDFRSFGGLQDYPTVPPSDQSGVLLVSTSGLIAGSKGSVVLDLRKTNEP